MTRAQPKRRGSFSSLRSKKSWITKVTEAARSGGILQPGSTCLNTCGTLSPRCGESQSWQVPRFISQTSHQWRGTETALFKFPGEEDFLGWACGQVLNHGLIKNTEEWGQIKLVPLRWPQGEKVETIYRRREEAGAGRQSCVTKNLWKRFARRAQEHLWIFLAQGFLAGVQDSTNFNLGNILKNLTNK